jgi:hypothetical protein
MSRHGSSRSSIPTDEQLDYAAELGISVPPGINRNDLSLLIDEAVLTQPPTQRQRERASELGVVLPDGITVAQAKLLLDKARRHQPATPQQREFAQRIGIEVSADATVSEASEVIDAAVAVKEEDVLRVNPLVAVGQRIMYMDVPYEIRTITSVPGDRRAVLRPLVCKSRASARERRVRIIDLTNVIEATRERIQEYRLKK